MLPFPLSLLFFGFGCFLTGFLIWRRLLDLGYSSEKIFDFLLLGGLTSALLFYWFPLNGFWFGLFLILFFFSRQAKWPYWSVLDEIVYGLLPGLFFLQIGNFFAGRLLGKPTQLPWGLYLANDLLRRQPIALYAALFPFFFWLFLKFIERRWRNWPWRKGRAGLIASLFLFVIPLGNFLLAFCHEVALYSLWPELFFGLAGVSLAAKEVFWSHKTSSL
jgi:prolipoprotein diacylglyceryltransferase